MTATPDRSDGAPRRSWSEALRVYGQRPVLSMLFLGFSAGLPFYLVFQTLSAWLRQDGIERATIGMLAWVGLVYSIKFLWSPIVDRLRLPLLHRLLGRRRSWMLVAQAGIGIGLLNLAGSDPQSGVMQIAIGALFLAFCSATQDISIDAWRIESASVDMQGAMAAAYQLGYRAALITGGAGALGIAQGYGWATSYTVMALLAGVGIVTTLLVREPQVDRVARIGRARSARRRVARAQGALARVAARVRRDVHRRGHLPAHGFLLPLRRAPRRRDVAADRLISPDGIHDGFDGEPVLHRPRLHARADRDDREGHRPAGLDGRA